MNKIGRQLMQESKADITGLKMSWTKRDLLSLLLRANVSPDLSPNQRMSDTDVLSRESYHLPTNLSVGLTFYVVLEIPTFMVAGHETTRYV